MKSYCEFDARLESLAKVKEFLAAQLANEQLDADTLFDFNVAIEEVFTNIIKYGLKRRQADRISIRLKVDAESLEAEVIDTGMAFNPLSLNDPDLEVPPEDRKLGGLGIYLIKKLMDEVHYRRLEKRNILSMRKNLSLHREKKE